MYQYNYQKLTYLVFAVKEKFTFKIIVITY